MVQPDSTDARAFGATQWVMFLTAVLLWGSSFLLIAIGLEHLHPAVVAAGRIGGGAAALALFPAARRPVPRAGWRGSAVLGITWMAVPFLLFSIAQQWIDSSLAGMLNASTPLFTALVAAAVARRMPSRRRRVGLLGGFLGVVLMSAPAFGVADAQLPGVGLVLVSTILYGVAFNLAVPLQHTYGALPVLLRAQVVALVVVLPFALAGIPSSDFAWSSVIAVAVLGALGTGLAFVAFVTLAGDVGATRASLVTYLMPVVAVVLGVALRGERLSLVVAMGALLTIAGAYFTSRTR